MLKFIFNLGTSTAAFRDNSEILQTYSHRLGFGLHARNLRDSYFSQSLDIFSMNRF